MTRMQIGTLAILLSLLTLPAGARGQSANDADAKKTFSKNGITITATVEPAQAKPGAEVELLLSFRVPLGEHIYGSNDQAYPSKLLLDKSEHFSAGELTIPKGTFHQKATGGSNYWLTGKQTVRQKITLAKTAMGTVEIAGKFDFMICDDHKCRPPAKIAFTTVVNVGENAADSNVVAAGVEPISIGGLQFAPAVRLKAGGELVATEDPGYACPSMADVDGDGLKDLLVGQFNDGKVKVFQNLGGGKFGAGKWLMAEGDVAVVPGVW